MQPDYNELAKRQQQDYQRSRDPFQYGQQVAQRRYSEIMSNLDRQRQSAQQSYGDLYSEARQRAVRGQAAGGPTLSGGMGQQQRDFVSAIEMQELGRIGTAREGAMRDLYTQGQSAFANAELEGQQATQIQLQNQQNAFQLYQQRQAILDSDLPQEQKSAQLAALGQPLTSEELAASQSSTAAGSLFGAASGIAVPVGINAVVKGKAQFAALTAAKETSRKVAADAALKAFQAGSSEKTVRDVATLAYKNAMVKAKAPTLGMSGKLYSKIVGTATSKTGIAKAFAKTTFKFAAKAFGIYAIISSVETLAELAGVAGGRGFSGLISKEGTTWDKFLEGVGL